VQDGQGAHQIRAAAVFAASLGPVARDALGDVSSPAAIGRGGIDHLHIIRSRAAPAPPGNGHCGCRTGRLGGKVRGQIVQHLPELFIATLRAARDHAGDHLAPLLARQAFGNHDLGAVADAANLLDHLAPRRVRELHGTLGLRRRNGRQQ